MKGGGEVRRERSWDVWARPPRDLQCGENLDFGTMRNM